MCCAFIPRSQKKQDHYCILKELIVWLSSVAKLCIESREHYLAGSRDAWPKFMQFISEVNPASYQNFIHSGIPSVSTAGCRAVTPRKEPCAGYHPWDFPRRKVFIFSRNRQCLLVLLWGGKWGAELYPPMSLWRCLLQSHRVGLFLNFPPTLTPGLGRGQRSSLCLILLKEVCSCTVPAPANSFPQSLVKASSAISAILLSIYV